MRRLSELASEGVIGRPADTHYSIRGYQLQPHVLESGSDGLPTVSPSMIPEFTRAVGVPRLAGIAYPLSRPMGCPGDAHGQREVLRALLGLLVSARAPDAYVELPYTWPETPAHARKGADLHPADRAVARP